MKCNGAIPETLKEDLHVEAMFDSVISMLSDSFVTLESENTKISGKILQRDDEIDKLYCNIKKSDYYFTQ